MDKQDDQKPLPDHEYDGIRELNNPAPFWWQLSFYLSILFGFLYYGYYEIGNGPSSNDELRKGMAEITALQNKNRPTGPDTAKLLALFKNPSALANGKDSFVAKCAACHVVDGGGLVGPNLSDLYWIHGKGKLLDIYKVVHDGVPDKGMPAWGSLMSEEEVYSVVVFVKSLQGTKPSNAKAPQGVLVSADESKD